MGGYRDLMAKRSSNIPRKLHQDDQELVGFFQAILDYQKSLIQVGTRVNRPSTVAPDGGYLALDGAVINNADWPDLILYAANDPAYVVGATTTTLPTVAGHYVKATA